MTLGSPIEIGKRYRLNIRPTPEYRCPRCHREFGHDWIQYSGTIVTVALPTGMAHHRACGAYYPPPEGMYRIDIWGVAWWRAVPYTWLEPLGEDDDIRPQ